MKAINRFINESTGIRIVMPSFEYVVILQSLKAYAENDPSKKRAS